jgi:hypothetical protein
MSRLVWMRAAAGATVLVTFAPALAAGAVGLGVPGVAAIPLGVVLGLLSAAWSSRHLQPLLEAAIGRSPLFAALVVAGVLVLIPMARLSVFMADVSRVDCAFLGSDGFRLNHSCLSAYSEAARLSVGAGHNVYEESAYRGRFLGRLRVDTYHYPPPFLLLSRGVAAISGDFFAQRATWYALQVTMLLCSAVGLCWWIGGAPGGRLLLLLPFALCAPSVVSGLQFGNYQTTALSLAVVGLALIASSRLVAGTGFIAIAAATKIFPGLLVVYLLFARRWKTVAATAAWCAVLVALTVAVTGVRPFVDFVQYEMPRISDGSAFPQANEPRTAAVNNGFYGMVFKLRMLGWAVMTVEAGQTLTAIYGVALLAVAMALGWRRDGLLPGTDPRDRLDTVALWLALVGLASFRSPFVGAAYGMASTMWLVAVLAARDGTARQWILGLTTLALAFAASWMLPPPRLDGQPPAAWVLWGALAMQLATFAINGAVVVRALWRAHLAPVTTAQAAGFDSFDAAAASTNSQQPS